MFCKHCGKKLAQGSSTCKYCGKSLIVASAPAVAPVQAAKPQKPKKADKPKKVEKVEKPPKAEKPKKADKPKKAAKPDQADKPKKASSPKLKGVFIVLGLAACLVLGLFVSDYINGKGKGENNSIVGTWIVSQAEYQGKLISARRYMELTGQQSQTSFSFNADGFVTATGPESGKGRYASEDDTVVMTINGDTHTLSLEGNTLALRRPGGWLLLKRGSVASTASPAPTERVIDAELQGILPEIFELLLELIDNKSAADFQDYGMTLSKEGDGVNDIYEMTRKYDGNPWRNYSWRIYACAESELPNSSAHYVPDSMDKAPQVFAAWYAFLVDRYGEKNVSFRFDDHDGKESHLSPSLDDEMEAIASGRKGKWSANATDGGHDVQLELEIYSTYNSFTIKIEPIKS